MSRAIPHLLVRLNINPGQWIAILNSSLVQLSIIETKLHTAFGLTNQNDIRSPLKLVWFDQFSLEHRIGIRYNNLQICIPMPAKWLSEWFMVPSIDSVLNGGRSSYIVFSLGKYSREP